MDFQLKQWRSNQDQSDQHQQQPSAKMPKLLDQPPHQSALPLFVPEHSCTKLSSNLSAFPDLTTITSSRLPGMCGFFSLAQWQELELQALIFRYMLAGAAVPPELLQPIKKSLLSSSYYLHHPLQQYSNYQPAYWVNVGCKVLQAGYWGRAVMDPEPGRCRRTDGKKWRCSRDVVVGQKYCERHVHRGRNRSRKPVEIPTPANTSGGISAAGGGGGLKACNAITDALNAGSGSGSQFTLSGLSPSIDILHLSQRSSESKTENMSLFETQKEVSVDARSDGRILRRFFDDWPRSLQQGSDNVHNNSSSATCLSMSISENSSSDFSLKLSTGDASEPDPPPGSNQDRAHLNWGTQGWGTSQVVASLGGPLAEALRSSTSNSSPTSVLHQLPRSSASDTSYVST
ncbi:Glutamine-Leucine-Glutamine, QLQ [Dillenia turbinata]|uniref:Growth-regulating factor n=1 Tax=Dillenia turbinata TaxID=194707 RepID=A0AAN8WCG2_9MAGN